MPVVRALREAGHDALAINEIARGAADDQVLDLAFQEGRVLITEDRDFGELVYSYARPSAGVILLRFPSRARQSKATTVVDAVSKLGSGLDRKFVVMDTNKQQAVITRSARSTPVSRVVAPVAAMSLSKYPTRHRSAHPRHSAGCSAQFVAAAPVRD